MEEFELGHIPMLDSLKGKITRENLEVFLSICDKIVNGGSMHNKDLAPDNSTIRLRPSTIEVFVECGDGCWELIGASDGSGRRINMILFIIKTMVRFEYCKTHSFIRIKKNIKKFGEGSTHIIRGLLGF